jgi:hypothetical protein
VKEKQLAKYEEKKLWRVEPRVFNIKTDGYRLDLLSIWVGPTSRPKGYYLQKSCRIRQVATSTNKPIASKNPEDKNVMGDIKCDRNNKFVTGSPPPQQ